MNVPTSTAAATIPTPPAAATASHQPPSSSHTAATPSSSCSIFTSAINHHRSTVAADSDAPDNDEEADADAADSDSDAQPDTEFFFESDHLALRGNADYAAVLRTIAVLQTQRMQVTRNIDRLAAAERRALDDPLAFVRQLQAGKLAMPGAVTVAELPSIDFGKYGVSVPEFVPDGGEMVAGENGAELGSSMAGQSAASASATGASAIDPSLVVRGRMFDQSKPETFNQLWTCEEQKRLEELLIEYPPEAIEMRRFAKIARALGNRTTKQVASRLQKFFKKLHSAGMPVPGRIPKSNRQYVTKAQRMHKLALRSTTFFPAQHVPYHLADEDDDAALAGTPLDAAGWYRRASYQAEEDGATSAAGGRHGGGSAARRTYVVDGGAEDGDGDGDENAKIVRLAMRIKVDKERETRMEAGSSEHVGFKCDLCTEEPIIGTRWHCQTCASAATTTATATATTIDSVDFCSDCLLTQLQRPTSQRHPIDHRMIAMRVSLIDSSMDRVKFEEADGDSDEYGSSPALQPVKIESWMDSNFRSK